jgi:hypothetical protein
MHGLVQAGACADYALENVDDIMYPSCIRGTADWEKYQQQAGWAGVSWWQYQHMLEKRMPPVKEMPDSEVADLKHQIVGTGEPFPLKLWGEPMPKHTRLGIAQQLAAGESYVPHMGDSSADMLGSEKGRPQLERRPGPTLGRGEVASRGEDMSRQRQDGVASPSERHLTSW